MKRAISLVLALTATAAAAGDKPPVGSTAKLDRRIAIVERGAVWQSELDEAFVHAGITSPTKEQTAAALDALIDAVIVDQAADAAHVTTNDAELDMAIKEIEKQNNIDDAGLDKALTDQHFTREAYRIELARQLRAQKLFQQELVPRVTVTEDEIKKAYDAKKAVTPGIDALDKIHDTIKQMVWTEKLGAAQDEWMKKRRAAAHVEKRL